MAFRRRFVLVPLTLLAALALGLFLLGRFGVLPLPWNPEAQAQAESADGDTPKKSGDEEEVLPIPVELARARARQIAAYYRAASFVEADRQVEIVARTAGRVRKVNVEEGDWVSRGDVLAELENDRERIRLRQEEVRLEDQRRELEKRKSLLEQSLLTQEDFARARSAFDLAATEKDLAAIALEETLIRAPFDGQITDRKIVPGQHINISQALFTLVDFEPLRVRIHLPEAIARKIRPGDEVHVVVEAHPDPVDAVVERVAPVVDPSTSTVRVTLLVDADAATLRVGGFVKVRITTDTHTEALSIPKIALVEEGGLRSVFLAEADSVRKVEVRTGLHDESHVEILDGLRENEYVVRLGQGGLRNGSRIEVLNAAEVGWVTKKDAEDGEDAGDGNEAADGQERDAAVALSDEGDG